MPLHDTPAYVLRTFTLKEADKICVFLTREAGKVRGVAKGARRLRSRFGASLEPFTEVQLTYYQNESRELVSLSNCEILRSPFVTGVSSERLGIWHYLAELVQEFLPDHEPNEVIYRLVGATIEALGRSSEAQAVTLTRYFEIWLLRLSGYLADLRRCGVCETGFGSEDRVWLNNEGSPRCYPCSGGVGDELPVPTRRLVTEMLTQPPTKFLEAPRDEFTLAQIGALTTKLIARILERELKSHEVLDRLKPGKIGVGG
jgi:DNA repair protein RecO (recombination protein O)